MGSAYYKRCTSTDITVNSRHATDTQHPCTRTAAALTASGEEEKGGCLKDEKKGDAGGEEGLAGLMAQQKHCHQGSCCRKREAGTEKSPLRDTPLPSFRLSLVHGKQRKSQRIGCYEIYLKKRHTAR